MEREDSCQDKVSESGKAPESDNVLEAGGSGDGPNSFLEEAQVEESQPGSSVRSQSGQCQFKKVGRRPGNLRPRRGGNDRDSDQDASGSVSSSSSSSSSTSSSKKSSLPDSSFESGCSSDVKVMKTHGERETENGGSSNRTNDESSSSSSSSSDDDDDEFLSMDAASGSETSDDDVDESEMEHEEGNDDDDDDKEEEEEEERRPEALSKPHAKSKYCFVRDFMERERGCGGGGGSDPNWLFQRRRIGSLDLAKRLSLLYEMDGHDGCVNALGFDERGTLLASGSDDRKIIVWEWERRKKRHSFPTGHVSNVFQSKFLAMRGDGAHIVSTSRDGQVRLAILDGAGRTTSIKLAQHRGSSNKLALLPSCPHAFVSCGEDGVLFSVDVRQSAAEKLAVQKAESGKAIPIHTVSASPVRDHYVATAGRDRFVRVYDRRYLTVEDSAPLFKHCPSALKKTVGVTCAVWNHDGTEILATYSDDDIYLFDSFHPEPGSHLKRFQGHRNSQTVKGVNFYGPRSEFVVSGSDCGNLFLWDKETESIVRMEQGDVNGVVNVLEPHPHLPVMATSGLDSEVKIWFPTGDKELDLNNVEKTVTSNVRGRKSGHLLDGDWFEGRMLWVMLNQLRRRRMIAQAGGSDLDSEVELNDVEMDETAEDDGGREEEEADEGGSRMPPCSTS